MTIIFLSRYIQVIKLFTLITIIGENDIPPFFSIRIHSSMLANRHAEILKNSSIKLRFISFLVILSGRALLGLVKAWLIWNSLFRIVTSLRAGLPRRLDSIPIRDEIFSLPRCSQIGDGSTKLSTRFLQGALSPRGVTAIQCRGEECVDLF